MKTWAKSLLLLLSLASPLFGSSITAQDLSENSVKLRTRAVLIDALVKDKRTGTPIRNLSPADFLVLADGKPRNLTHFSPRSGSSNRPLALILFFDLRPGGAGRHLRSPAILDSLCAALGKLPPGDEVAVAATWINGNGGRQKQLTGFTRDREKVYAAIRSLPAFIGDRPTSYNEGLPGAIQEITQLTASERPDSQPVLVYVSDGFHGMANSERDKHISLLIEANVMFSSLVCSKMKRVSAGTVALSPLFALTGASLNVLDHFVKQTGGELVRVQKPDDYGKGLERIVGNLVARYSLGFELSDSEPDDGKLHRLEVRAKAPDKKGKKQTMQVLARRGYYLPKKQEPPKVKPSTENVGGTITKDEQQIRQAIYDLRYAEMSGDVESFKRLTAKRTLDLYRLWFNILFNKMPQGSTPQPVSNGDELFSLVLKMLTPDDKNMNPDKMRKEARAKADARIIFINDQTAEVEPADGIPFLAVREEGRWKIDETEALKQEILKMEGLTSQEKEMIRKY